MIKSRFLIFTLMFLFISFSFLSTALADDGNENEYGESECADLNTAPIEYLIEINGVDEDLAEAIIEYRESNTFFSIDDLGNVEGFNDGMIEEIKEQGYACVLANDDPLEDEEENETNNDVEVNENEVDNDTEQNGNENNEEDEELLVPETSTNFFNFVIIGIGTMLIGLMGFIWYQSSAARG